MGAAAELLPQAGVIPHGVPVHMVWGADPDGASLWHCQRYHARSMQAQPGTYLARVQTCSNVSTSLALPNFDATKERMGSGSACMVVGSDMFVLANVSIFGCTAAM